MNTRHIVTRGLVRRRRRPDADGAGRRRHARISRGAQSGLRRPRAGYYPRYKKWCDEYFYLRTAARRAASAASSTTSRQRRLRARFRLHPRIGETFLAAYPRLVRRHMNEPGPPAQREHQLVRRGRYAEFNLIYDRGTKFGLKTGGNVEAILMSLPPEVRWPWGEAGARTACRLKGSAVEVREIMMPILPRERPASHTPQHCSGLSSAGCHPERSEGSHASGKRR